MKDLKVSLSRNRFYLDSEFKAQLRSEYNVLVDFSRKLWLTEPNCCDAVCNILGKVGSILRTLPLV